MPTVNARPGRLDIATTAGDDLSVVLTHVDELGAAEAVTASAGWVCEVLDRPGGNVLASPTVTRSGGSDNVLTVALADVSTGQRDCWWRLHDSTNDRAWLAGRFTVHPVGEATTTSQTNAATVQVTSTAVTVTVLGVATGGGGGGASAAADVSFTPTGSVAATNVQAAIAEVATEYAAADTALDGRLDTLEAISIATDAELASAISAHAAASDPHGDRVYSDAALSSHLGDTSDAHDASAISFSPAGSISATTVQAAIEEVASEAGGGGGATTYKGARSSPPASPAAGDLWIVDDDGTATDDSQVIYRYNGSAWVHVAGKHRSTFGPLSGGIQDFVLPGVSRNGDVSTTTFWNGVQFYFEIFLEEPAYLTEFSVEVLNTVANAECYLGLYKANTSKLPAGPVVAATSTALAIATPGVKTKALASSVLCLPGRYFLSGRSGVADGVSVRALCGNVSRGSAIRRGVSTQPHHGIIWATGGSYGALPSTPLAPTNYPYSGSGFGNEHFIFPTFTPA